MKKYECVVVSCTERNLDLVGSFDDKIDETNFEKNEL